jgi:hypothetical protein
VFDNDNKRIALIHYFSKLLGQKQEKTTTVDRNDGLDEGNCI